MGQRKGCIMYEFLREFLGYNFVSGKTLKKTNNLKNQKPRNIFL